MFSQDPHANPRLALQAAVNLSLFLESTWSFAALYLAMSNLQSMLFVSCVCAYHGLLGPLQLIGKPRKPFNLRVVIAEVRTCACTSQAAHHGLCVLCDRFAVHKDNNYKGSIYMVVSHSNLLRIHNAVVLEGIVFCLT